MHCNASHRETHFLIGEISRELLDLLQIVAFDCTKRRKYCKNMIASASIFTINHSITHFL